MEASSHRATSINQNLRHVNNIPTMQYFTGISRNTQSKSYMLSLSECVWDFHNNALWDTLFDSNLMKKMELHCPSCFRRSPTELKQSDLFLASICQEKGNWWVKLFELWIWKQITEFFFLHHPI